MSLYLSLTVCFCVILAVSSVRYEPNWDSIDSRPLPAWYDEAKIGIFLTWGVFSVPSFDNAWFWWNWEELKEKKYKDFMKENYPPDFTYADFAAQFKAELYNPDKWADIFKASGAKYLVLVSKFHEGYTMWPSKYSWNWNAYDVGPHRDLVGELANSIRNRTDIRFGMYHSLYEFFNPLFLQDKANNYTTQTFVQRKSMPELYEMVNRYKPEVVWSDGDWDGSSTYWNSTNFLAWLYNESPVKDTVVTNDRWGNDSRCKHGGFWNCKDRYNPGKIQPHKWENSMTIDRNAWTYHRDVHLADFLSIEELLSVMAKTISCGGNLLMNAGPTSEGLIPPIYEERLRQMGRWLDINGEAIYGSQPWFKPQDDITETVWYTTKKSNNVTVVYAMVLEWPEDTVNGQILSLGLPIPTTRSQIHMIGYDAFFNFSPRQEGGIDVEFPPIPIYKLPTTWAWVLKIEGLKNA